MIGRLLTLWQFKEPLSTFTYMWLNPTVSIASGKYPQPHYTQRRLKHGLIDFPTVTIRVFVLLFLRKGLCIFIKYKHI